MPDDRKRFAALYERHYAAVLRYAARRVDPDTARDVVSETFLAAWRRMNDLPDDADEELFWLYRAARGVVANERRRLRRRQDLDTRIQTMGRAVGAHADHAAGYGELTAVRQAMETLSENDQELLRLVAWERLDHAGLAAVLGCSRRTLAVRLHRARRRLDAALRAAEAGQADQRVRRPAPSRSAMATPLPREDHR